MIPGESALFLAQRATFDSKLLAIGKNVTGNLSLQWFGRQASRAVSQTLAYVYNEAFILTEGKQASLSADKKFWNSI